MAQTVASQQYINLSVPNVIDNNYNREEAYWRSVKVFWVAYAGYDQICPQLLNAKEVEYTNAMREVYGVPNPNQQRLGALQNEVNLLRIRTIFGIKRIRGHLDINGQPTVQNVRVVFSTGMVQSNQMPLNMNSDVQSVMRTRVISFPQLRNYRIQNTQLKVQVIGDNWVNNQGQLLEFVIGFREISAEGFEDWFNFGRGLQLKIKIQMEVYQEPAVTTAQRSYYHLHTLYYMVRKKFLDFDQQFATVDKRHNPNANKSKISYIRKRVDPTSETAFWVTGTDMSQILQRIRTEIVETGSRFQGSQIGDMLGRTVKFADFQISVYFEDEYEDTVCVCSEWCNWNAFFRFNPMYRFLLVNHNLLYLDNKTNVADMHLFCAASMFQVPTANNKLPILNLITHASDYRSRNYQRYFMTNPNWQQDYLNSDPLFQLLNGLAHKMLKQSPELGSAVRQSSTDPFADICCQNLINYYKVLSDLHSFVSTMNMFIHRNHIRNWFKELDHIIRLTFGVYLTTGQTQKLDQSRGEYDFLFSEDFEYRYVFIKSLEIQTIKSERDRIYQFAQPINPLNIKFNLERMVSTFVSIHKVMAIVEPMISIPRTYRSLRIWVLNCKNIDTEFGTFAANNLFNFFIALDPTQPQGFERNYYAFYTLKLYSVAFGYQKYCITWFMRRANRQDTYSREQVCTAFNSIWKYKTIEQRFRDLYPTNTIFDIPLDIQTHINDFYTIFWGPADHERNAANANIVTSIDSGFKEYTRLYYWWQNDGDNRSKFVRILDVLVENQISIGDQTRHIFRDYILHSVSAISGYPFQTEVLDHLVYYLVKAFSSMILNSVSEFMLPLHRLQINALVRGNQSYTLCKPGWVPLFRTMNGVFQRLDQIKQSFIIYDDENNRISNAISETKNMIKEIYGEFYQKLVSEWVEEILQVLAAPQTIQYAGDFISLHLASGLSFMCAFVNQFREEAQWHRKRLRRAFVAAHNPNIIQHVLFHDCEQTFRSFQKNKPAILEAKPFFSSDWVLLLNQTFQAFQQIPVQVLGIDLNTADIFI